MCVYEGSAMSELDNMIQPYIHEEYILSQVKQVLDFSLLFCVPIHSRSAFLPYSNKRTICVTNYGTVI